jgi:hypothetical protein
VIVRRPGSTEPAGLVMESAFIPLFLHMPNPRTGSGWRSLRQPSGSTPPRASPPCRTAPRWPEI